MPCESYSSGEEYAILLKECDKLAKMLCTMCVHAQDHGYRSPLDFDKGIQEWWNRHKEKDRLRRKAEAAEERRKLLKKNALEKLSQEERRALGLHD